MQLFANLHTLLSVVIITSQSWAYDYTQEKCIVAKVVYRVVKMEQWSRKAGSHGQCKSGMPGWQRKELNGSEE